MMEFWTAVAAIAAVGQVVVLIVTAIFVRKYLQETSKLRLIAQEQAEAQIRPALTMVVSATTGSLLVSNVGSGAALNLRLFRTKVDSVDWEAKSNFGAPAMGAAVACGQSVDTMSSGMVGQFVGEHLQLIYESLSGRTYASVVTFEGSGRPAGVRFLSKSEV